MKPYYSDAKVSLYCGRMEEVLPAIDAKADAAITDPPYEETSLEWDRWPQGWPDLVSKYTLALWCFGSFRMFMDKGGEFGAWKLAQDVVWEKQNGSGLHSDRFRRVHELAAMFYRGEWASIYKEPVRVPGDARSSKGFRRNGKPSHYGSLEKGSEYLYSDTRLMRSVIQIPNCHRAAIHPTQKPEGILRPLIEYSVPPGGCVLDVFAGSGSLLAAAKSIGRRAIGIEASEPMCEQAAQRLSQGLALEAA